MGESFFGLNIAVSGLFTAQRSLNTVNHNISNVNTPGYSRQNSVQAASMPYSIYDGTGMIGTGSEVLSVDRVRDEYLDFKYWSENVTAGEWEAKDEVLSDIEATFNEPSDSGFTTIMNDFYNSLQELAKDPGSEAVRALVKENGVSVAKYFNSMANHFEKLQADVNYRVKTKVEEINSYATQIQQLNKQIYLSELDGNSANDLRDQRTLMTDKLSKLVNIEASEVVAGKLPNGKDDRHFVITISGKALVDHFSVSKLSAVQRQSNEKLNAEDIDELYEVGWADGNSLKVKGGELKGFLDIRDGNEGQVSVTDPKTFSPIYKGLPFYQKKLNEFVRTYAKAFNEGFIDINGNGAVDAGEDGKGHVDGYGTNGSTGIRFFTMLGEDNLPEDNAGFLDGAATQADLMACYNKITAKNFSISSEVTKDTNSIAAADTLGQKGNINNLNELLKMRSNDEMFSEGAPEDFMKSLVATLGIDSQQATRYSANQSAVVTQISNRRTSVSGVSLDEEMTSMVKFQNAYNASAKMIQTMSEIYDTLINKLGV